MRVTAARWTSYARGEATPSTRLAFPGARRRWARACTPCTHNNVCTWPCALLPTGRLTATAPGLTHSHCDLHPHLAPVNRVPQTRWCTGEDAISSADCAWRPNRLDELLRQQDLTNPYGYCDFKLGLKPTLGRARTRTRTRTHTRTHTRRHTRTHTRTRTRTRTRAHAHAHTHAHAHARASGTGSPADAYRLAGAVIGKTKGDVTSLHGRR